MIHNETQRYETLLQLTDKIRQAPNEARLNFILANEVFALVHYQRAFVVRSRNLSWSVEQISGLVEMPENTPMLHDLRKWLAGLTWPTAGPVQVEAGLVVQDGQDDLLAGVIDDWNLLIPVAAANPKDRRWLLLTGHEPWPEGDLAMLAHLSAACQDTYRLLAPARFSLKTWLTERIKWQWGLAALGVLAALVFIPVPATVTAPAEVIALKAEVVTAPQDGVVREIVVAPNSEVRPRQVLLMLDDTSVASRRRIAVESLKVAQADAMTASQRAFSDDKSKADLTVALGRVAEKRAELAAVDAQMRKIEVIADRAGIAVFSNADEWAGKPVQTGQKIMQIARPEDAGLLVWLSVFDAINLVPGSRVKLFLHIDPLNARTAEITEASYLPELSPASIASYRVKARFSDGLPPPRMGLRGTARLSGEDVSLGYYVFRRPIAALREWTGW